MNDWFEYWITHSSSKSSMEKYIEYYYWKSIIFKIVVVSNTQERFHAFLTNLHASRWKTQIQKLRRNNISVWWYLAWCCYNIATHLKFDRTIHSVPFIASGVVWSPSSISVPSYVNLPRSTIYLQKCGNKGRRCHLVNFKEWMTKTIKVESLESVMLLSIQFVSDFQWYYSTVAGI